MLDFVPLGWPDRDLDGIGNALSLMGRTDARGRSSPREMPDTARRGGTPVGSRCFNPRTHILPSLRVKLALDRIRSSGSTLLLAVLVSCVLLAKLPTPGVPPYWDEVRYIEQARWLSERSLVEALPGLRPAAVFFGHPPGLHVLAAATWKLTGVSVAVAHLLVAVFTAIGVCGAFLLGRHLYGTREALLAAVLLLLCPLYFAQGGMFLADVPVAALGVLGAWFVLRNRYAAWVVAASVMVLMKETAVAVVVALIAYRFLVSSLSWKARLLD